jgi:hypothetical protein
LPAVWYAGKEVLCCRQAVIIIAVVASVKPTDVCAGDGYDHLLYNVKGSDGKDVSRLLKFKLFEDVTNSW